MSNSTIINKRYRVTGRDGEDLIRMGTSDTLAGAQTIVRIYEMDGLTTTVWDTKERDWVELAELG